MGFLVEIPPFIRERLDNVMLFALWHSPITPPTDLFLKKFVQSIEQLTRTGVDILIDKSKMEMSKTALDS
jgi:hypothetical protein